MGLKRMDNVGIVVDDLAATIDFFRELGLDLEGQATIEGEWAGRVTGLGDQRVEIAMMRTPDGHGRLELSRFLTPPTVADHHQPHWSERLGLIGWNFPQCHSLRAATPPHTGPRLPCCR